MTRLSAIPYNVITGFLGVGKTTCILDLLKQKPVHERWAILVNEFGEIGLDGQLLENSGTASEQVFIREVPGGCMCCSSGVPMQIALNLLLMKARPDRLLIEPTGLGHPQEVIRTLKGEHFAQVLSLQTTVTLVNPKHFSSAKHLQNTTFQQQLAVADVLVVNKTDLASDEDILAFEAYRSTNEHLTDKPYLFTERGHIPLDILANKTDSTQRLSLDKRTASRAIGSVKSVYKHKTQRILDDNDRMQALPECGHLIETHEAEGFISIGWRVDQNRRFDLQTTLTWLASLNALRIKAMLHCAEGWVSINTGQESNSNMNTEPLHNINYSVVNNSEPSESRLEMIFEQRETADLSRTDWQQCLVSDTRR